MILCPDTRRRTGNLHLQRLRESRPLIRADCTGRGAVLQRRQCDRHRPAAVRPDLQLPQVAAPVDAPEALHRAARHRQRALPQRMPGALRDFRAEGDPHRETVDRMVRRRADHARCERVTVLIGGPRGNSGAGEQQHHQPGGQRQGCNDPCRAAPCPRPAHRRTASRARACARAQRRPLGSLVVSRNSPAAVKPIRPDASCNVIPRSFETRPGDRLCPPPSSTRAQRPVHCRSVHRCNFRIATESDASNRYS